MTDSPTSPELDDVVAALAAADRVLIASHENPDGDAIGSMSAAALALRAAGKQVRLYLHPDSPLPHEYGFLNMDGLERSIEPGSTEGWTLLALDCGNESRLGPDHEQLRAGFAQVIDVDHHHDNSRFGDVNYVDGHASSTAEILARICDGLGIELTPSIAEALYVGLVTDTGRFQYRTTSPAALRLAARLVEAGADVHKVFELVFETLPLGKMQLPDRQPASGGRRAGGGADPRAGAAPRWNDHAQPRIATLARLDRRVPDRSQVAGRRPQAGGRLLAPRQHRGDPRVHRG
jgi:phosphoesterase RecJ-like protein